ncbi:hypothetical protein FO519_007862 [Halicephalobus sp. NKZ332]|nr:hypothetical protein FO519_007862 [Halicephalobus sp. NKZ332]
MAYRRIFDREKIIVYNIGLEPFQVEILQKICNVFVENFPFEKFPNYFKILNHYRWKPIVIAMALKKYGHIIYADTSVIFKSSSFLRIPSDFSFFNEKRERSPYLLHSSTGHTIYPVTMSSIYDYFPTDIEKMKSTPMYEAGLVTVFRTRRALKLLKWYVLCALEKNCMVPSTTNPIHYCGSMKSSESPECHRFDQSVINVLLANQYLFNVKRYVSGITDFFSIQRNRNRMPSKKYLKSCN